MKPIRKKYPAPLNLGDKIVAPVLNAEIENLLAKWQRKQDSAMKGMQSSLTKCVNATLQLNSMLLASDVPDDQKTKSFYQETELYTVSCWARV